MARCVCYVYFNIIILVTTLIYYTYGTIECNFEFDLCTWSNEPRGIDDFDWVRFDGSYDEREKGPLRDHTTNSPTGVYYYLDTSGIDEGQVAHLRSETVSAVDTQDACLSFYYYRNGSGTGDINVYYETATSTTMIWSSIYDNPTAENWFLGQIAINASETLSFIVEGVAGSSEVADIAIDDIEYVDGQCLTQTTASTFYCDDGVTVIDGSQRCNWQLDCPTGSDEVNCELALADYLCTFEEGMCGWRQDNVTDDFDWTRWKGDTPISHTGPGVDHTLGTSEGYYLFVEANSVDDHDRGRLISSSLPPSPVDGHCLQFWYHMLGSYVGDLNIYVLDSHGTENKIWTRMGTQGNEWRHGQRDLHITTEYEIIFEASRITHKRSDIAIDDLSVTNGACPPHHECDFEYDFCGWNNTWNDTLDWLLGSNGTETDGTGPTYDHTTGTATGQFAYIDTSSAMVGHYATLSTTQFTPNVDRCLTFWYHMYGEDVGSLEVHQNDIGNIFLSPIWSRSGNQGNIWRRGSVPLPAGSTINNYIIVFQGIVGGGGQGDIAIDDALVDDSSCQPEGWCSFERDTCGWTNERERDDEYDWLRNAGTTSTYATGPKVDHTLGTGSGYFMFIETSSGGTEDRAWLVSEHLPPTSEAKCFKFWYHMFGHTIGTLNVYFESGNIPLNLRWSSSGDRGEDWYAGQITVNSTEEYWVIFEAIKGDGDTGDIAIDDTELYDGACVISTTNSYNCTFEEDLCSWRQDKITDDFNWKRNQGDTPTSHTGPTIDHTLGTNEGYYLFIEADSRDDHERGRLISTPLPPIPSSTYCLTFWYHMFGGRVGDLNVYVREANGLESKIWTRTGTQADEWRYGQRDLHITSTYEIIFEATRITHKRSDIAIDDLSVLEGTCPPHRGCDFEYDFCGWTNVMDDELSWLRGSNGTNTEGTGPTIDHTTGTESGHFVYINTSSAMQNHTAELTTVEFTSNIDRCLRFWYHMYGEDIGSLHVFQIDIGNPFIRPIWSRSGNQQDMWRRGSVPLPIEGTGNNYKILFRGVVGDGSKGDIAMDDILVDDIPCQPEGWCDFDTDTCGWTNELVRDDNYDWVRNAGTSPTSKTGPKKDHTLDNQKGYYMYIETDDGDLHAKAWLVSEHLQPTTGECFQFWYHMFGSTIATLNVYFESANVPMSLRWSTSGDHEEEWHPGQITVNSTEEFWIIFESTKGGMSGDIAVDDTSLQTDPCSSNQYDCTFETDLCIWRQDVEDDDFNWTRRNGDTPTYHTGPKIDHTLGTNKGYYLYVEANSVEGHERGRLISDILPPTTSAGFCLQFWYHMFGSVVGDLNVYVRDAYGIETKIWARTGTQANEWRYAQRDLYMTSTFEVIFEVTGITHTRSDIAIDDLFVHTGSCPPHKECDFEFDICGWTNVENDNLDWLLGGNGTDTEGTGPQIDHTTGTETGHFAYIETTSATIGHTAVLTTTEFNSGIHRCLKFWYHMYGQDIGSLHVYQTNVNHEQSPAIWSRLGNQDDMWRRGTVHLPIDPNGLPYWISFEGVVGDGAQGDIAIDDILVDDIPCQPEGWCDFETDTCGWTNELVRDDNYDWLRNAGSSPTSNTGPTKDHTLGTPKGYYMFIETDYGDVHARAWLVSEHLQPTSSKCFIFWYHMSGSTIATLNVYFESSNVPMSLLWSTSGDHGEQWHQGRITVNSTEEFWIIFEATKGGSIGDIAIDDTALEDVSCASYDYDCTFEKDLCSWRQDIEGDDFDWIRRKGDTPTYHTGPKFDHTLGTNQGYYLYVEAELVDDHERGRLISAILPATSDGWCLQFWYHMLGSHVGDLNVYVRENDWETRIWTRTGTQANEWRYGQRYLHIDSNFEIIFEVTSIKNARSDIAIDDLSVHSGSCPPHRECDFEYDFCGWTNADYDNVDWLRGSNGTGDDGTGPTIDHTTGTETGHFAYIETTTALIGHSAVLTTTEFSSDIDRCLTFWYHMYGQDIGSLHVYQIDIESELSSAIWSRSGNQDDMWRRGTVPLPIEPTGNPYLISFEGVVGGGSLGDIAIDDILVDDILCQPEGWCDFEMSTCGWTNDLVNDDEYDWMRNSGTTPTSNTGPTEDHTLDSRKGYYMYIETNDNNVGDRAWLVSEHLQPNSGKCFMFWYHMYGDSVGNLNVYVESANNPLTRRFSASGNHGDLWHPGQITVNSTEEYWIIFEATKGGSRGDIGVDDTGISEGPCPINQYDCTFEDDFCTWRQDNETDDFDWTRHKGSTPTTHTGPTIDHTLGTSQGYYLYIEANSVDDQKRGRLISDIFPPTTNTGSCIQFWYHMLGSRVGDLNVYVRDAYGTETKIWTRTGTQADEWRYGQRDLHMKSTYEIIFEATRITHQRSDIAIDDLSVHFGACPPHRECDFEYDFCGWTNMDSDELEWLQGSNGTETAGTGPSIDHTTGTETGHFAYIETTSALIGHSAILTTTEVTSNIDRCLTFWYHMYGQDIGSLHIYQSDVGNVSSTPVWSRTGNQDDMWRRGTVPLPMEPTGNPYLVSFEGVVGNGTLGDIAIDDVLVDDIPCKPEGWCDFEMNTCGWTNDLVNDDDYDWLRNAGTTPTTNTGPKEDHTIDTGKGYYMYIESSDKDVGDRAWLVSEHLQPSYDKCFTFWYHMYGTSIGILNVYVESRSNPSSLKFSASGDHGEFWHPGQITVNSTEEYWIIFEATKGGTKGDIAVDDTALIDGACPSTQYDCAFEEDLCTWRQDDTDDFDWTRHKGSTETLYTGPMVDHTLGTSEGYYLYIEANSVAGDERGRLISDVLPPTTSSGYCLQFWYHMLGNIVGDLNVYVRDYYGVETKIWSRMGTQADEWRYGQRDLYMTSSYEIIFEVTRITKKRSDIAIDDLSVHPGPCPPHRECDFEYDFCGWTNRLEGDELDWLRGRNGTETTGTGPTIDHTTGTATGYFAYIETSTSTIGHSAVLTTTEFTSDIDRCLRFWYHMYGEDIGSLNVYQIDIGNIFQTPIWSRSGNQDDMWRRGSVPLPVELIGNPYMISFEGVVGNGTLGDIAIDDVIVDDVPCQPEGWCDFEMDTCGWTNELVKDDDYNWLRNAATTPTGGTGPKIDHTLGTAKGYYMVIETNDGSVGDRAWLVSEHLQPTSGKCFMFWYHMYGGSVGNLNVYVESANDQPTLRFSTSGNHGDLWHRGQITVNSTKEYWIILEATNGGSSGDIGVDDTEIIEGPCPINKYDCTFEEDFCTWKQDNETDDFDWTRHKGSTPTSHTGPKIDHTLGTSQGYYLYIEANSVDDSESGRLISDVLPPTTNTGSCLQFWYHMLGSRVGDLNVYVRDAYGTETKIWTRTGTQADEWRYGQRDLHMKSTYKIIFEATRITHQRSDIAIDDLSLHSGACPPHRECDFEYDFCGWTNTDKYGLQWLQGSNGTETEGTGPSIDHTTGTETGHFAYIETTSALIGHSAILTTTEFTSDIDRCLTFWYHMYGQDIGSLHVYQSDVGNVSSTPVWSRTGNQDDMWRRGTVPLPMEPTGNPYLVSFEGVVGNGTLGDIAIDDVLVDDIPCQPEGWCDFEMNTCGWTNDLVNDDDYDWIRNAGTTPTSNTGPKEDHTIDTGKGYYMYIESSDKDVGDRAWLVSEHLQPTYEKCFTFWYHMYGTGIGILNVYVESRNKPSSLKFSTSGDHGEFWHPGQITVNSTEEYWIIFVATKGGTKGDIAVDDTALNDGACPTTQYDCTFEEDLCTWRQDDTDDFDWTRHKGSTQTLYTGPTVDHTLGTSEGYYLYIEANSVDGDERGRLISDVLPPTTSSGYCLQFWYHMLGNIVGDLNVYVRDYYGVETKIWSRMGTQADEWRYGQRDLHMTSNYEIIFEVTRITKQRSDIAIDDLSVHPGPCPPHRACDFEYDFCGWTNSIDGDELYWLRGRNGTETTGTGPTIDHTTGTATGHFAYIETSTSTIGHSAVLTTTEFTSDIDRCLRFWYHMYGEDIGSLNVYQIDIGNIFQTPIWSRSGNQDDMWRRGTIPLPVELTGNPYLISFQGVVGNGTLGDIAIDDVLVDDVPCQPEGWCDFEMNTCGWTNELVKDDDYNWIRNAATTPTGGTGPKIDHTLGTAKGYYMVLETSDGNIGDRAWLVSEHLQPTSGKCFKFWYHMFGATIGTLRVYFESAVDGMTLLWTASGDHGDVWKNGHVTVNSAVEYWIIFEATNGGVYGDIAVDDTEVDDGDCPVTTPPPTSPTPIPTYPPDYHDCDFEINYCTWTYDEDSSDFDWTRITALDGSLVQGPPFDHTTGTETGYYIIIESSVPRTPGEKARIISGYFNYHSPEGICMKFWYHMLGAQVGVLNIYLKIDGQSDVLLWMKQGDHGPRWGYDNIHIPETRTFKIVIEGTVQEHWDGHIALDDVFFNIGECPTSHGCDFENSMCGFSLDPLNEFNWYIVQAMDSEEPLVDVTYGTSYGHYIYANKTTSNLQGSISRFVSGVYDTTESRCLRFAYYMSTTGNRFEGLGVYVKELSNDEYLLWSSPYEGIAVFQIAEVTINHQIPFQIIFEAVAGSDNTGHLAIDDIDFKDGGCEPLGHCAFEHGDTCTWSNVQYGSSTIDQFDWMLMSGAHIKSETAPTVDHTIGTAYGTYLYLSTSGPRVEGDVAILMSVHFEDGADQCMRFWYYMHGSDTGTLSVIHYDAPNALFSVSGSQGSTWIEAYVDVPATSTNIVTIRGIVGSAPGDIAIDDISFTDGLCPPPPPPCEFECNDGTGNCLPMSKVCDFNNDCDNHEDEAVCGYQCTFETGECGWNDTAKGQYQWIRWRGATPTSNTGPAYDHTTYTQQGWYIYVDANVFGNTVEWAHYTSPTLQQSGSSCELYFWYHMKGKGIGTLRVHVKESSYESEVWSRSGDQGDNWNAGVAIIGRMHNPFFVVFEAQRTFNVLGDIAVDDIIFEGCTLPEIVPSCQTDQFRCTRGSCVESDRLCDYNDDCGDYSDEAIALCDPYERCDFESGMCDWTNLDEDELDWELGSGGTFGGAKRDHTIKTYSGHYMYIPFHSTSRGDRARIGSMYFVRPSPTEECEMRFWYYMTGFDTQTLNIYTRTSVGGPMSLVWSFATHSGDYYRRAEVVISPSDNFQVIIEGVRGKYSSIVIAIDDISFTPGCQVYNGHLPIGTTPLPTTPYNICGEGYWPCANGEYCIYTNYYCNWNVDCPDESDEMVCGPCDFETGLCGYEDYSQGMFKWNRVQGADKTTGNGWYMLLDHGNGINFNIARIYSPSLPDTSEQCSMSFWRLQPESGTVLIVSLIVNGSSSLIWESTDTTSTAWQQETIYIGKWSGQIQVLYFGSFMSTSGVQGIGIDDILFHDCAVSGMYPMCQNDEYQCHSGSCVKNNLVCDFTNDCDDSTDELTSMCAMYPDRCNFETGFCSWAQSTNDDDFDWILGEGSTMSPETGPDADHTRGDSHGQYAYVDVSYQNRQADVANLVSDVFSAADTCQMRLFYHMYGRDIGTLRVSIRMTENGKLIEQWSASGDQGNEWARTDITIMSAERFQASL
ncbi:MAM and LDL-receptor class A domain-containing protein 2-like [Saccoglossus kowalevskii]